MCPRNQWRFSRPCAQLLNVSSTYLNQHPGFNVEVAKAFFSNSSMNKLAITGDNGLPIGHHVSVHRISLSTENMS